jgi:hypothetical protein
MMIAPNTGKLPSNVLRFIAARLSTATDTTAAAQIGVTPRTVRRWKEKYGPAIDERLDAARNELVGDALAILKSHTPSAAAVVVRNLVAKRTGHQLRAAELLFKLIGTSDLAALRKELADLRQIVEQLRDRGPRSARRSA